MLKARFTAQKHFTPATIVADRPMNIIANTWYRNEQGIVADRGWEM